MQHHLPVRVTIDYKLAEYIGILDEIARQEFERGSDRSWLSAFWNSAPIRQLGLLLLAPPIFCIKKVAVGTCVYEFDTTGLQRWSKGRRAERRWSQVKAIHFLQRAYVIELEEGFLPLPFRAFSDAQRMAFGDLVPPETPRITR